jgi:formylglycine-generating enzyme
MKTTSSLIMVVLLTLSGTAVLANTFTTNNPSGTAPISFAIDVVAVGDAGNAGTAGWYNTAETFGAVNYNYYIGKTEVTVGQFNAMEYAITGNDAGLGSTMAAGSFNPIRAFYYANWLNAGCPTGGAGVIDGGVYNMTWTTISPWAEADQWDNGDGTKNIWRNKNAKYFLPTEDEMVKAAFYKGGSTNAGYWAYQTSSDAIPTAEGASAGTNSANYANAVGATLNVGSYPNTMSPYGALDMAGNQWEMTEVRDPYVIPGWMDGYVHGSTWLRGTLDFPVFSGAGYSDLGFRMASVIPEPATLSLLGLMASFALLRRKQ